jgi:diguanylate cyclase (GGDEF)-like protein
VLGLLLFHWLPSAVREWKKSEERTRDLQNLAAVDPLTGVFNRRHFEVLARAEIARSQRYVRPVSFLMIDIDQFKRVNDSFGQQTGDWVLRMVAMALSSTKRDPDIAARFGGEEFVMILPETTSEAARIVAERIRATVHANALGIGEEKLALTISIGISECRASSSGIEAVIHEADAALYEAKRAGRNRVCLAKPSARQLAAAAE